MKKTILLAGVFVALALNGTIRAATFEVTSLADSGAGTLRDAVTSANANASGPHTITFQVGLTGTVNLDTTLPNLTQPLTITGPGAAALTVRRNGAGTYGAFYVTAYSTMTNLTVSGMTFKNFNHNNGAIYVLYAQGLTISNCVFDGNASGERAGVFADQMGTAIITGCVFTNNSGASSGAALQCNGPTAFTVTDCVFASNTSSGNGGAFFAAASYYVDTVGTIQRCSFVGNSSSSAAGAAQFSGSGSGRYHQYNVSDCTFSGNYATFHSGAIYNGSPYLRLVNCTISGNVTGGYAGGVTAGDNSASGYTTFINCTVTGNRCGASDNGGNGGGIYAQANTGRAILRNTIVAGNVDSGSFADNPDLYGGFTSQGWNLIGMTNGSPDFTNFTDIIGSIAAPAKPRLSALGDYGGPTKTHVLMQGSPALDKGNVSGLGLTTDQRGLARVVDETGYASAVGGDGSDIGSTERFTATNSPPVIALDPLDVTLKSSSNTVLTAGAIGTEPIAYQWRKNGVAISGATNNELSFTNIQPWDAGNYDFVAVNAFGSQTSQVAVVTPVYLRVSNPNDSGAGSLRQAVTDANTLTGPDSIYFLDDSLNPISGTINLDTALPNLVGGLNVFGPGAAQITLRRNGAGTFGAFNMTSGSTDVFLFSGLKFQNFNRDEGAIYAHYHTLTVSDCVFDGNASAGGAAGVHHYEGIRATVTGCLFTNNTGRALNLPGTQTFDVTDSTFVNNTTASSGAGISFYPNFYAYEFGTVRRCTFTGNYAGSGGGALYFGASWPYGTDVIECTFNGNSTGNAPGGAIHNGGCTSLRLIQCTISGNTAGSYAGGVNAGDNFSSGNTTFINCTVTGNRCGTIDSGGNGGGIYAQANTGRAILRNTIVAGNVDSGLFADNPDVFGGFNSQSNNFIGMTNGSPDFTNSMDIIGSVAAPVSPLLAPLANYGGPTLTHMPFAGSPVLDKGNITGLGLANDQRGLPRLVDDPLIANASGGDGSDIGATEGSVSSPLEITQHPQSLTVQQGQNATFTVVVSGVPLGYQWRKNGGNIPNTSAASFTITNTQSGDAGTYSVVISNAVSSITSSNAFLTVTLPPAITADLIPIAAIAGQPGCLEIAATGAGPFTYQWRKNGVNIPGATDPRLLFTSLTSTNAGNYDVIVSGPGGSVTSSVATVTVWTKPAITTQPVSQTATNGATASFTVNAGGTLPIEYQWRRNGVPIPGANSATYTMPGAQPFQAGTYDVVIGNGGGSVVSTPVTLTVQVSAGTGSYAWTTNDIRLQRVFGGTSNDSVNVIIRTSDGGYLLGGGSFSGITGNKTTAGFGGNDGWVVKVDASGNKVWDVTLGGTSNEAVQSLSEASNGGYFIGLLSSSGISGNKTSTNYGGSDYWVVKLNTNGAIVWDKNYGTINDDSLYAVAKTTDGGCVVGGYAYAGATGNRTNAGIQNLDFWMLKLDASGNRQWERSYGGTGHDFLLTMQQTPDGGYILGGDSGSGADGNKSTAGFGSDDFWVVKLDSNGDKVWDKSFGGTATDQTPRVATTADGGYIFVGKTQSGISGNKTTPAYGSYDIWIVKVDSTGTKQWEQAIGDASTEYPYSVEQTSDGGYIISGNLGSSGDTSVVKLDGSGTVLWTLRFGGNLTEANGGVVEAAGGDFVLATGSPSGISGNKTLASLGGSDMWFVKFAGAQPTGAMPVLTQVPANLTAAVGANASFSVAAANGPTSYAWRHNGDIVVGATTATLNFSNLQLTNSGTYSVTASNASGTVTSPDFTLTVVQDTDGDGLPDSWEIANGTNPNVADAGADPDGDKLTNWQEYLTGTGANDFNSKLVMAYEKDDCGTILYGFNAVANLTYTLQTTTNLRSGPWVRVLDAFPAVTNRSVIYSDYPVGKPVIFYRVVTPMAP